MGDLTAYQATIGFIGYVVSDARFWMGFCVGALFIAWCK